MLVLVTVVCVYLGWAMNWIRQREAFLKQSGISYYGVLMSDPKPPFALRLLGERGLTRIYMHSGSHEEAAIELAQRLFPEALISYGDVFMPGPDLSAPQN
jgi:hypothetical protein